MSDNLISQNAREGWVTLTVTNEGGTGRIMSPTTDQNSQCVVQLWCCLPVKN